MDARITPNRSLSKRSFAVMLAVVAIYNVVVMGFLLLIGAFPVPVFLGIDFLALYLAFRVSYRRGGVAERVQVCAERVQVLRGMAGREQTVWSSPTAFTRVSVELAGEHEAKVRLRLSSRSLDVGGWLSPQERTEFGSALERAILSARTERHPA